MIKAVIFDFDGLIIDTETPWYEAYKEVFSSYHIELPVEIWAECIGTTFHVFNPMDYLEERLGRAVDRDEIKKETKTRYSDKMKGQNVRPGVVNYLKEAKNEGLRIGLASSSTRNWVESYLSEHELNQYFEVINTSDDVSKVKPDPELYINTMTSLQVEGNETVVFEDSLNGLRAAKAAGAHCVIVPNQVTAFMPFENYDLRLGSMAEMPLREVIARL